MEKDPFIKAGLSFTLQLLTLKTLLSHPRLPPPKIHFLSHRVHNGPGQGMTQVTSMSYTDIHEPSAPVSEQDAGRTARIQTNSKHLPPFKPQAPSKQKPELAGQGTFYKSVTNSQTPLF